MANKDDKYAAKFVGIRYIEKTDLPYVLPPELISKMECDTTKEASITDEDPWALTTLKDDRTPWNDLSNAQKIRRVLVEYLLRVVLLVALLYVFVCSLDIMSSAFRLLGGKTTGEVLSNDKILSNPVAGLMIGVLATVLVQSSSTSTSITITMVANDILQVGQAVYIIMGANIGTSVTNTIVSLGHVRNRSQMRKAFAGATVHDMFNWLCVLILLPLEVITNAFNSNRGGYLFVLSDAVVKSMKVSKDSSLNAKLLKYITEPISKGIIQIDKSIITDIARGKVKNPPTIIKIWCKVKKVTLGGLSNDSTLLANATQAVPVTKTEGVEKCHNMFEHVSGHWPDWVIGVILLVISLFLLCFCLVMIVKLLHSLLKGEIANIIRKFVNSDFPGHFSFLTGYVAIVIGAGLTICVQSSSIFTSAITPLVGVGVLHIDRMYPLTLGANIGTTTTGIFAALASSSDKFFEALQLSFVHLFFNITGILIWYPVPLLRRVPIGMAKVLGNTTANYLWFPLVYLILMFFVLPALVFGLSVIHWIVAVVVVAVIVATILMLTLVNKLQAHKPGLLPKPLRSWKWLPKGLRSLQPYDDCLTACCGKKCRRFEAQ